MKEHRYAVNSRKLLMEDNDDGNDPYNHGFVPTLRTTNDSRLPISSGSVPFKLFSAGGGNGNKM